jgi:hypothetical protein
MEKTGGIIMMNSKNMGKYIEVQKKILEIKKDSVYVVASKVENKKQDQTIRLHILEGDKITHPFEFPMSKLESNIKKLKDYGYPLNGVQITEAISTLREKYHDLHMTQRIHNLGWQSRNEEIIGYLGEVMIDMEGKEVASDPFSTLPTSKGDMDVNLLSTWLADNVKRQITFISQLAGVIACILNKNIVIGICGKSSTGKTTVAKLAQSAFASENYEKTNLTFNGTENALLKQMDGMRGTGVLIDDTSLSNLKDFTGFIYKLAMGTDKARLRTKDFQVVETEKWTTSIVLTAETSILGRCNPDLEGAFGRMIEITVEDNELFDSAEECNRIQHYYRNNYGLLAPLFVKHIIQKVGIENIQTLYIKELTRIQEKASKGGVVQRLCENFAILTLTAKFLEEILSIRFNTDAMEEFLIKGAEEQIGIARGQQTATIIQLEIYEEILERVTKKEKLIIEKFVTEEVKIGKKHGNEVMLIKSTLFREIVKEMASKFGVSVKEINRIFKEEGFLKRFENFEYTKNHNGTRVVGLIRLEDKNENTDTEENKEAA